MFFRLKQLLKWNLIPFLFLAITYGRVIIRKDRKTTEILHAEKNFMLKSLNLINNKNLKEKRLGTKKLHLNRKANIIFAKNLLIY